MGQKERNTATEVVDGVVETVDVSKHPTASIEPSDLSLADIERRKSHPVRWILFMAARPIGILCRRVRLCRHDNVVMKSGQFLMR